MRSLSDLPSVGLDISVLFAKRKMRNEVENLRTLSENVGEAQRVG